MNIHFLSSTRDGTKVWIRVEVVINGTPHAIEFERETGCKLGMDVLVEKLRDSFYGAIQDIRRSEYEAGFKAGRGKKQKSIWFANNFSYRRKV